MRGIILIQEILWNHTDSLRSAKSRDGCSNCIRCRVNDGKGICCNIAYIQCIRSQVDGNTKRSCSNGDS